MDVLATIIIAIVIIVILKKLFSNPTLTVRKTFYDKQSFLNFETELFLMRLSATERHHLRQVALKKEDFILFWEHRNKSGRQLQFASQKCKASYIVQRIEQINNMETRKTYPGHFNSNAAIQQYRRGEMDSVPKIYCYRILNSPKHANLVKVGYAKHNVKKRVEDQLKTAAHLDIKYEILFTLPAITVTGRPFMDHAVHRRLKAKGVANPMGEWFRCSPETARKAVEEVQNNRG